MFFFFLQKFHIQGKVKDLFIRNFKSLYILQYYAYLNYIYEMFISKIIYPINHTMNQF